MPPIIGMRCTIFRPSRALPSADSRRWNALRWTIPLSGSHAGYEYDLNGKTHNVIASTYSSFQSPYYRVLLSDWAVAFDLEL